MPFVEYDDMTKALALNGADHPLRVRILPWRSWRADDFFDTHVCNSCLEILTVDPIAIADQKSWRFVLRKGFDDLLSGPFGRWMLGDIEVNQLPSVVAKNDKREEDPKCCGGHRKEINTDDVAEVIIQKRTPGLRRWLSMPNHILVNGRFGHVVAEQL